MLKAKAVFTSLVGIREQLEPLCSALSDDGLDVYNDDLEDVLNRVNILIVMLAQDAFE